MEPRRELHIRLQGFAVGSRVRVSYGFMVSVHVKAAQKLSVFYTGEIRLSSRGSDPGTGLRACRLN